MFMRPWDGKHLIFLKTIKMFLNTNREYLIKKTQSKTQSLGHYKLKGETLSVPTAQQPTQTSIAAYNSTKPSSPKFVTSALCNFCWDIFSYRA